MSRQVFRHIIFAFAVVTILLVGSVCGNGSVDLGADVDGSSVLLESSIANDPMTGVTRTPTPIPGRRRVVAVRKRTQTATTPTPTQTSSGDVEVFEPLSAEDVEAMKRIAQHPPPEEALDAETIRLLDSESASTEPSSSSSALKRPRSNSMEKMPPVKDRKINEQQSIPINQVQKPTAATNSRRVVRKPVTSKPRKMVNRTPKAQGMNILQPTVQVMLEAEAEAEVVTETETEADAEQENALTTGVSVYPTFSLGQVVGGVTRTIGMLRNAIQADPATVACPGGVAGICKTANHFTYVLDPQPAADLVAANAALAAANTALATANANGAPPGLAQAQVTTAQNQVQRITSQIGRMHRAFGWVRPPVGLGGTNPTAASTQYCDVLFKPTIPFATGPLARPNAPAVSGQAGRNLWPTGHIMGDALGGMNNQPLNFFPQYRWSNAQSGRWGKAEAIALQVAGRCAGGGARVAIQARFTAWDARGIYPAGGHYTIYANAACVAALGAGCTQNGAAGPAATAGNANVRTFCRWSTPTGNGGLRYSTPFSNGITDRVMSRPIAQRRRFFP